MQLITKKAFSWLATDAYTENHTGVDRTSGNRVAIQPMLGDFSEEIIVVSIIAAEKG